MSLEHAILGFLNYSPETGYDLKKEFDLSVRHFWPADQSQIYRTLSRLADKGWVSMTVVKQADRPDRKVYSITEEGKTELHRWLGSSLPVSEHRNAELIQVFFAGQLSDAQILEIFESEAKKVLAVLDGYSRIPNQTQHYVEKVGSPREAYFWYLTLECGLQLFQAQLAWLESVIQRIKAGQVPQG
jgi:DNA-binding PadR family transcriptional regulator